MEPERREGPDDPAASFRAELSRDLEDYVLEGLGSSSRELLEHLESLSWDRLENTIDRISLCELRAVRLLEGLEAGERHPLGIEEAIATEVATPGPVAAGGLRTDAPLLRDSSAAEARLEAWFARVLGALVHGLLIESGDLGLSTSGARTLELTPEPGSPEWNIDETPAERSAELSSLLTKRLGVSPSPGDAGPKLRLRLPDWAFSPA